MCEGQYLCTVLAHQGFVQCASVFARELVWMNSCARTCTYVRCEPTRASCFCACGAGGCTTELKCESLYACTLRAHKGFVRCEPTRVLYHVLVLAHQGFVQCASVLVRKRVQISSCTRTFTSVRCKPTRDLCNVLLSSCTSACVHDGFVRCACADERMCESMCCLCGARPQRPCIMCSCK